MIGRSVLVLGIPGGLFGGGPYDAVAPLDGTGSTPAWPTLGRPYGS